jgi:hypothetical protein
VAWFFKRGDQKLSAILTCEKSTGLITFRDFSLGQQPDKIATETKQWSKYFIKNNIDKQRQKYKNIFKILNNFP